jgi:hypothetical protein
MPSGLLIPKINVTGRPYKKARRGRRKGVTRLPGASTGKLDPYPDPMLAAFVPYRVELLRPRWRGRWRWHVQGCVRRRVCRPRRPPCRRWRWRFAFVRPHIARPVGIALRQIGLAMCIHGRVALRRTDSGRCDGDGRHRNQRDRDDVSDEAASETCHRRPPRGPVLDHWWLQLMPSASALTGTRLVRRGGPPNREGGPAHAPVYFLAAAFVVVPVAGAVGNPVIQQIAAGRSTARFRRSSAIHRRMLLKKSDCPDTTP